MAEKTIEARMYQAEGAWEVAVNATGHEGQVYRFTSEEAAREGLWRVVRAAEEVRKQFGVEVTVSVFGELGAPPAPERILDWAEEQETLL